MADRGDVLQFASRIGFGASAGGERAVVIQASPLNSVLPTLLAVPLDVAADPYLGADLLVRVPAAEAGAKRDHVAIPTHIRFLRRDQFEPGRVGRLRPKTLADLDDKLRLILDL
jgi:mRNA-degrading endonuclease toxin of MazEF toxin-antitoxin module